MTPRSHLSRPRRGYALLEALVALLVLSIGVATLAQTTVRAIHSSRATGHREQAVRLAHEGAEIARLAGPGSPWTAAWQDQVARRLPDGRATLCRDAATDASTWACAAGADAPLVVKLGWTEPDATRDAPRLTLSLGDAQ